MKMPLVFIFMSAQIIDHVAHSFILLRSPSLATVDRADRVSFSVEAMVTGYHTYKDIWAAVLGVPKRSCATGSILSLWL